MISSTWGTPFALSGSVIALTALSACQSSEAEIKVPLANSVADKLSPTRLTIPPSEKLLRH
ncbi:MULTISPECIES: hypothetical protein [unclassified Mycolicibacterium]|uniref:hypothetical protein n=1 Tax=unclassified Mycolicibacterium TaxID=2636767 RepID=UPI0012DCCF13|nr:MULTISPECIES: hypothetical protein [unclassified Mycolicibacterium]MUL80709.1 hypothetical protein [Mycolicibacterium sp. CBMA 329]MUL86476.1 hypothetical protein [Mycolicibacterium sp. CBMA 331]MUM01338.1 hypothetical protein [Mycolicibacterium sp. CBMA 334]MUM25848.1 hypothetical protein [Mycolicibacterium sp. CBMA 295]MUM36772.1 hypothetical protein [Mycolicibacterium sp. CBMA 247]